MCAYLEGHGHGAVLHQLLHHGCLAAASVEPPHVAVLRRVKPAAGPGDPARGAVAHVGQARLLHDAEVLDVLPHEVRETALTTLEEKKTLQRSKGHKKQHTESK